MLWRRGILRRGQGNYKRRQRAERPSCQRPQGVVLGRCGGRGAAFAGRLQRQQQDHGGRA